MSYKEKSFLLLFLGCFLGPLEAAQNDQPICLSTKGPFVSADFLYWQANVDGLEFAFEAGLVDGGNVSSHSRPLNMRFEWDPGFRIGLGYLLGKKADCWDVYANWTHLNSHAHRSKSFVVAPTVSPGGATDNILLPLFFPQLLQGFPLQSAKARWTLNFNTIDLELGREYLISRKISLRPHTGLRGAFLHQHIRAVYTSATIHNLVSGFTVFPGEVQFNGENDFNGIGLCGGANFLWHFTKNFGLYAQAAGSLLYGQFLVQEKFNPGHIVQVGSTGVIEHSNFKVSEHYWRTRASFEAAMGFAWEILFHEGAQKLIISAGYELSKWWSQNQLWTVYQLPIVAGLGPGPGLVGGIDFRNINGDLGFQGGTLKALFSF